MPDRLEFDRTGINLRFVNPTPSTTARGNCCETWWMGFFLCCYRQTGKTFPVAPTASFSRRKRANPSPASVAKPLSDKQLGRLVSPFRTIGTVRADGKIEKKLPFGIIGNRHL